jgi:peptidyl-lysine (3S)-dioxygenase / protease
VLFSVKLLGVKARLHASRNADAPTLDTHGNTVFAKPHEEYELFEDFIDYLTKQEIDSPSETHEVRYAQTRKYTLLFPSAIPTTHV